MSGELRESTLLREDHGASVLSLCKVIAQAFHKIGEAWQCSALEVFLKHQNETSTARARAGKGLVDNLIGKLLHVVGSFHPADLDAATVGDIAEGLCRVESTVCAAVRSRLFAKHLSFKSSDEVTVLCDQQDPTRLARFTNDGSSKNSGHSKTAVRSGSVNAPVRVQFRRSFDSQKAMLQNIRFSGVSAAGGVALVSAHSSLLKTSVPWTSGHDARCPHAGGISAA